MLGALVETTVFELEVGLVGVIRCVRGGGLRESTRSVQVEATCGGEPREVTDEEEACNIRAYEVNNISGRNLTVIRR